MKHVTRSESDSSRTRHDEEKSTIVNPGTSIFQPQTELQKHIAEYSLLEQSKLDQNYHSEMHQSPETNTTTTMVTPTTVLTKYQAKTAVKIPQTTSITNALQKTTTAHKTKIGIPTKANIQATNNPLSSIRTNHPGKKDQAQSLPIHSLRQSPQLKTPSTLQQQQKTLQQIFLLPGKPDLQLQENSMSPQTFISLERHAPQKNNSSSTMQSRKTPLYVQYLIISLVVISCLSLLNTVTLSNKYNIRMNISGPLRYNQRSLHYKNGRYYSTSTSDHNVFRKWLNFRAYLSSFWSSSSSRPTRLTSLAASSSSSSFFSFFSSRTKVSSAALSRLSFDHATSQLTEDLMNAQESISLSYVPKCSYLFVFKVGSTFANNSPDDNEEQTSSEADTPEAGSMDDNRDVEESSVQLQLGDDFDVVDFYDAIMKLSDLLALAYSINASVSVSYDGWPIGDIIAHDLGKVSGSSPIKEGDIENFLVSVHEEDADPMDKTSSGSSYEENGTSLTEEIKLLKGPDRGCGPQRGFQCVLDYPASSFCQRRNRKGFINIVNVKFDLDVCEKVNLPHQEFYLSSSHMKRHVKIPTIKNHHSGAQSLLYSQQEKFIGKNISGCFYFDATEKFKYINSLLQFSVNDADELGVAPYHIKALQELLKFTSLSSSSSPLIPKSELFIKRYLSKVPINSRVRYFDVVFDLSVPGMTSLFTDSSSEDSKVLRERFRNLLFLSDDLQGPASSVFLLSKTYEDVKAFKRFVLGNELLESPMEINSFVDDDLLFNQVDRDNDLTFERRTDHKAADYSAYEKQILLYEKLASLEIAYNAGYFVGSNHNSLLSRLAFLLRNGSESTTVSVDSSWFTEKEYCFSQYASRLFCHVQL